MAEVIQMQIVIYLSLFKLYGMMIMGSTGTSMFLASRDFSLKAMHSELKEIISYWLINSIAKDL